MKRMTCGKECQSILQSGDGNPASGRTYRTKKTHPDWANSISKTSTERQINSGDKNGTKNPDVAARIAATRSKRFQEDPDFREQVAEYTRKAWADGKYDGVKTGKCKWYDHVTWKGEAVKLQGTWEVAFARRLDELEVDYVAHQGSWVYVDGLGVSRCYYVDFYVPMWDVFVDVKGAFWDAEQAEKVQFVRASNPDKTLFIATKSFLLEWGVRLLETQKELLEKK